MASSSSLSSLSRFVPDCFNENLILPLISDAFKIEWVQAISYLVFLLYLFLGIAIIADIFMCAIEKITSKTKIIQIRSNGSTNPDDFEEVEVKVWNDTVANLTLMALGSSAPEILLSIIEIVGNGFEAGDLGPGTIVGSAAFNLLIITGVCIVSIPRDESRTIKAIKVFGVTSFFSIFAYMWLFMILVIITPNVVDLWEAVLTFIMFPLLVFLAYFADRDFFRSRFRESKGNGVAVATSNGMELDKVTGGSTAGGGSGGSASYFPKGKLTKKSLAKFVKEIRKVDPHLTDEDAACLAATYIFENEKHSRLFYRVSACRQMTGSRAPIPHLSHHLQNVYDLWKMSGKKGSSMRDGIDGSGAVAVTGDVTSSGGDANVCIPIMKTVAAEKAERDKDIAVVQFSSPTAIVLENAGKVTLTLERFGRLDNSFDCVVETLDRTAIGNVDYKAVKSAIHFDPNETEKSIDIEIIDDKNWNPDKVFLVRLTLPDSYLYGSSSVTPGGDDDYDEDSAVRRKPRTDVAKGRICIVTVTIIDDDEPGVIAFGQRLIMVGEGVGKAIIPVIRDQGADGEILVKYKTIDGTAKSGRDYVGGEGELKFPHGVIRKELEIPIVNDFEEEKDEYFEVMLMSATNGAKVGKLKRVMVTITNDDDYNTAMGKLMEKIKLNRDGFRLHREAWLEQFRSAMRVSVKESDSGSSSSGVSSSGANGEEDDETPSALTILDYVLHVASFGWKILFAAIPPVGIWGGWLTFFCSLVVIGLITAVVGDVASTFGCLVGLEKPVNAITFVALGTSLPDLFASRTAARMERYADNAIGNVTGSNSVNVFLGLGLPWMVAAIYWAAQGKQFNVPAGSLGFSVGLYTAVSLIATGVLLARRMLPAFGPGELGGPPKYAKACAALFLILWLLYIGLSALQTYKVIAA